MKNNRKQYSAEQKYKIVKSVLNKEKTVSQIIQEHQITASMFYNWQDKFLSAAKNGLDNANNTKPSSSELRKITELEAETKKLKDVIAEITSENISLKKNSLI